MLALLLTSLLVAAPAGIDDEGKGPSKEAVKAAVQALEKSLAQKEPAERIAGLRTASDVEHPDVIAAIKRGLADKEKVVRQGAIEILGAMSHADALGELHAYAKRARRTLTKDPEYYATLLKSIARHGDPSSIPYLTDKIFVVQNASLVRARVLGLGNIRDKKSVEALIGILNKTSPRRTSGYMGTFQLAFINLIGVDRGINLQRWQDWWNDNKKTYELLAKPPKMPEALQRRWDNHWGIERRYERNKKRGDRGNDPEDDGGKRRGGGI